MLHTQASLLQPVQQIPAGTWEEYQEGIQCGAAIARAAVKPETQRGKDRDVTQLALYLASRGLRSLLTFVPEDFYVYFTKQWLPSMASSPRASTVQKLISNLSMELDLLGRQGQWRPEEGSGKHHAPFQ